MGNLEKFPRSKSAGLCKVRIEGVSEGKLRKWWMRSEQGKVFFPSKSFPPDAEDEAERVVKEEENFRVTR